METLIEMEGDVAQVDPAPSRLTKPRKIAIYSYLYEDKASNVV